MKKINHNVFTFDNENNIIKYFISDFSKALPIPKLTEEMDRLLQSIINEDEWKKWINSSGKADKTPDFYNDQKRFMMEIMRIDDHGTSKGNKTLQLEKKALMEIKKTGILDKITEDSFVFINEQTTLPTEQDHNFKRYRDNFVRVIDKHFKQVTKYRTNHPDYKLAFFLFDESAGYLEVKNKPDVVERGLSVSSSPHFYFLDRILVNKLILCEADYVIWYRPYLYYFTENGETVDFPRVVLFDLKQKGFKTIDYHEEKMISNED